MTNFQNRVFIACSLDGYIADKNGDIGWLDSFPNEEQTDMGYGEFMADTDALVMGRNTFETVLGFDVDWPYEKPVFVLSNSLKRVPDELKERVSVVNGSLKDVLSQLRRQGFNSLYIDGGKTIQNFLAEDLIDEMIITTIPVLLGEGVSLFGPLNDQLKFKCAETKIFLDAIVQARYIRIRDKN